MSIHLQHWNAEDEQALSKAETFPSLTEIALRIIGRLKGDVHMVSGPISTGGVGTVPGNMFVFSKVIELLGSEQALNMLSQVPFQEKMDNLCQMWKKMNPSQAYCMPILDDFYRAVFQSGKITDLHFIYGWESSFGSRWEHDFCKKNTKIRIHYLSKELSVTALGDSDNSQLYV